MKRISRFAALTALLALSCLPRVADAQLYGRPGQQQNQPMIPKEPVQLSGTVKQMGRGLLQVATDTGEPWMVRVEARPQDITYTATAEAAFIRPGLWVRFSTPLSKRGDAPEPITSLTVFTPREGWPVGVQAENLEGGSAAELFGDKPEANDKPKAKPDENTTYLVAGQVTKLSRTGEMTINARGTTVKAELAHDAQISLDMGDLSLLRPGDKIEITGWHPPMKKGQAIANKVTASAAQPLSGGEKKKRTAAANGDKPAKGKAGIDADKPAEDKPEADKPVGDEPAGDKPAKDKPDEA